MSLSNPRRPRIPPAFMPPDWSPNTSPSDSPGSAELTESNPPPSPLPKDPRSPTSSICSTVGPPSDVFASPPRTFTHGSRPNRAPTNSLRTNVRALKERQAAVRRAKVGAKSREASDATPTPLADPLFELAQASSRASSVRSFVASLPDEIEAPAAPSAPSPASPLHSAARNSLRRLKEQQAARRKEKEQQAALRREKEQQRQTSEERSLILAEKHRIAMIEICKREESVYESRWAMICKLAEARREEPKGTSKVMLRFYYVPWPVLPPIVNSSVEISTQGVEKFLLSPFRKPDLSVREKIEVELPRWEVEAFEECVMGLVQERHRDDVRRAREKVRAALEHLLAREACLASDTTLSTT